MSNYPGGTCMDLPGGMGISICYYCEKDSQRPPEADIILESWRIRASTSAAEKQQRPLTALRIALGVTQMNWDRVKESTLRTPGFWLFSRSLLKRICSTSITVSNYSAGQFLSDTSGMVTARSHIPIIRWANDATASSREHIPLRVTVEDPDQLASVDKDSCPRVFLRAL